jgi:uncharacterized membrane protein YvbJ
VYCSNCGSQLKPELNYCSRCGARVSKDGGDAQKSVAKNLSAALVYVSGFGVIGFIFVTIALVKNNVPVNALIVILFFYLATIFGICYLILQQTANFSEKSAARNPDFNHHFPTEQLGAANTAQLEEPKQMPISVTENTTKTLDEVLLKRN